MVFKWDHSFSAPGAVYNCSSSWWSQGSEEKLVLFYRCAFSSSPALKIISLQESFFIKIVKEKVQVASFKTAPNIWEKLKLKSTCSRFSYWLGQQPLGVISRSRKDTGRWCGQEAAQDTVRGFCCLARRQDEHFIRSKLCNVLILAKLQTACLVCSLCAGCAPAQHPLCWGQAVCQAGGGTGVWAAAGRAPCSVGLC